MGVATGRPVQSDISQVPVRDGSRARWTDMVSQHETYINEKRDKWLVFSGGGVENHGEMMFQPYTHRWTVGYTEKQYAQLHDFIRGAQADYENPYIVFLPALTASTVTVTGKYRPPLDHFDQIKRSWARGVRHELTHSMDAERKSDDYPAREWEYITIWEPTTNAGIAEGGYAHCHPVIVCDGPVEKGRFESVLRKHVEKAEWAEYSAHDVSETDIRELNELGNPAAYLFKYLGKSWSRDDSAPFQRRFDALLYESGYRRFQPSDGSQEWLEREDSGPAEPWQFDGIAGDGQREYLQKFDDRQEFEIAHERSVKAYLRGVDKPGSVDVDRSFNTEQKDCRHPKRKIHRGECMKCGINIQALVTGRQTVGSG